MRLLLVDDHALFLQSLRVLLIASGYEVVGLAADGMEALVKARSLKPDLILIDIDMPGCDGISATRLIKSELPDSKIAMLTVSARDEQLFEAIKSGASGYLLKSASTDEFLAMVEQVGQGGAALPPELTSRLMDDYARQARAAEQPVTAPDVALTPRQTEILALVADGLTYAQVGETLCLSEATVRYHMAQVLDRLHLENRAQAIVYAARHGLARRRSH